MLVLDFSADGEIDPSLARTVTSVVSAELSTYPDFVVIANSDVRQMMDLEGQRQQAGCSDASCLAELAGALGARLVVFGTVGKLGTKTTVALNVFDSRDAKSAGRQFVEIQNLDELSETSM